MAHQANSRCQDCTSLTKCPNFSLPDTTSRSLLPAVPRAPRSPSHPQPGHSPPPPHLRCSPSTSLCPRCEAELVLSAWPHILQSSNLWCSFNSQTMLQYLQKTEQLLPRGQATAQPFQNYPKSRPRIAPTNATDPLCCFTMFSGSTSSPGCRSSPHRCSGLLGHAVIPSPWQMALLRATAAQAPQRWKCLPHLA